MPRKRPVKRFKAKAWYAVDFDQHIIHNTPYLAKAEIEVRFAASRRILPVRGYELESDPAFSHWTILPPAQGERQ